MAQREGWDSVAGGWKEWWMPIEKGAQKLIQRLIELAEIKPGQRVLDIATGIGEPSITADKDLSEPKVMFWPQTFQDKC